MRAFIRTRSLFLHGLNSKAASWQTPITCFNGEPIDETEIILTLPPGRIYFIATTKLTPISSDGASTGCSWLTDLLPHLLYYSDVRFPPGFSTTCPDKIRYIFKVTAGNIPGYSAKLGHELFRRDTFANFGQILPTYPTSRFRAADT
jgi:hypothetical protein